MSHIPLAIGQLRSKTAHLTPLSPSLLTEAPARALLQIYIKGIKGQTQQRMNVLHLEYRLAPAHLEYKLAPAHLEYRLATAHQVSADWQ